MSNGGDNPGKTVSIKNLNIDDQTYRAISIIAYSSNTSVEKTINDMLKKQVAMQGFLKHGFELFHKDLVRTLANAIPDEKLMQEARNLVSLTQEMIILNVAGTKPDIGKYIKSFTSFMAVNGYPVSIDRKGDMITFFVKPNINRKYSLFWGEIIKMTLANLAEITKYETTESSVFIECRVLTLAKN